MTDLIAHLKSRGLLAECSDEDGVRALTGSSFYCGFDPTAQSLQVGNLVPLLAMAHLGKSGLMPIALFGGATGAIGDPSGRSAERQLLSREDIDRNTELQRQQFLTIFSRLNLKLQTVNNYDWTKDLSTLDFLRDCGKYFTVNWMMQKDSVKNRLDGEGISFTEFSYMLLQAYDFLYLYQHYNCKLQVGGSDQWGNITAGMELIRKKIQGQAYGVTFPLITNSAGKKLGKSESGTLFLDPKLTSPFTFHQYWLNVEDKDSIRFLKLLTFLDLAEIDALEHSLIREPQERNAQRALADSLCTLVHGESSTAEAKRSAQVLFGGSMEGLSEKQLLEIFRDVPSTEMPSDKLRDLTFVDLLVEAKLSKSKGEARRLIESGGAYLMNERVSDMALSMSRSSAINSRIVVLRSGKKNYHLIKQS